MANKKALTLLILTKIKKTPLFVKRLQTDCLWKKNIINSYFSVQKLLNNIHSFNMEFIINQSSNKFLIIPLQILILNFLKSEKHCTKELNSDFVINTDLIYFLMNHYYLQKD